MWNPRCERISSRPLRREELIPLLLWEHQEQEARLQRLRDALDRQEYAMAAEIVSSLHEPLSQHIVDEETKMLKPLIEAHAKSRAREAI